MTDQIFSAGILMVGLIFLLFLATCMPVKRVAYQDGEINMLDYGAVGDGETDNTAMFGEVIAKTGSDEARIIISGGSFLVQGITFPSNIRLVFRNGGMLHVPEESEVQINGSIEAGIIQIFSGEGAVTGHLDNLHVFPQWFGAEGDGIHNDAPALQKAADLAAGALGNTLFIPAGEYLFKSDVEFRSNVESRGLLVKEIEIDEERTRLSNSTFVPDHYPKTNPHIIFAPDHEEQELNAENFMGIIEGEFNVPVFKDVPLAGNSGKIELAEGGTLRFYSTDFFSSRNNLKGDQYYDKNDVSQIISGRGEVFPEFAFSYLKPPETESWQHDRNYKKGDYVSYNGKIFKATWTSGEGAEYKNRFLGTVAIGPVQPDPEQETTRYRFTFDDGSAGAVNIWRRVDTKVWYRKKDRPVTVNGLRMEIRLKSHGGESKRINGGAVNVNRSNITFNKLEITVRDREATLSRLLNLRQVTNVEFNNGYFSGATYHGLGYNILNSNVANIRYNDCISTNSRKGLDGRHGKNITITGGFYNVIEDHYGRNYIIKDIVMSGRSTYIPGYVTPDADFQAWRFRTIRPLGFAGANLHVENVTINAGSGGVFGARSDIGDLYGKIVLRDIFIRGNKGDVRVFNHSINPDFDYAGEVRVPTQLIIEDISLENEGSLNFNIGNGFKDGAYGPVSVRNSGPVGEVFASGSSITFSNCLIKDGKFETRGSRINVWNCIFSGTTTGLNEKNLGSSVGNILNQ